ncbi:MAG TPA: electron transfer flavoprotein subunit alpha/FixB family protein [Anaeromyxobacteraceae bacterium]|nr:electron transfer flavoprotein subunit alpha/FixB family protein [Anaeromyxobacteraceae bacterium]
MPNVLVVLEHASGSLRKAARCALGAGQQLAARTGGTFHAALLGAEVAAAAQEAAAAGATVHAVAEPRFTPYLAEQHAPTLAELARAIPAAWIVGAATAQGKDLLPRVAARLGAGAATDVLAFGGEGEAVTLRRPMWAGNVIADVEIATPVKVLTIRPTEFAPAPPAPGGAVVPARGADAPAAAKIRFLSFQPVKSERPELTEARVVVAGGRGTKGNFGPVEALADALGGAVGASRAAVDAGWVPNDLQVGQTGKVVAPDLYVAAGISGQIQHVAGMKGSKVIVAVNKDADAPIFQVADYGLVADLFEALPALLEKVKASR